MMQKQIEKEDAVSPVVGVMLMLVVTIIIAAVVAAFAGGLGGGMQSTPTAVFSVHTGSSAMTENGPYLLDKLTFTHKGGDVLSLPEIEVQLRAYGETKHFSFVNGKLENSSTAINPGDEIIVRVTSADYLTQGTPIEWSIIDNASGNKIASGSFVVP